MPILNDVVIETAEPKVLSALGLFKRSLAIALSYMPSNFISFCTVIWLSQLNEFSVADSALIPITSKTFSMLSTGLLMSARAYLAEKKEQSGEIWRVLLGLGLVSAISLMSGYFWLMAFFTVIHQDQRAAETCHHYFRYFLPSLLCNAFSTANDQLFLFKEKNFFYMITMAFRVIVELGLSYFFLEILHWGIDAMSVAYTTHAFLYCFFSFVYLRFSEKYLSLGLFQKQWPDFKKHLMPLLLRGWPYAVRMMSNLFFQFFLSLLIAMLSQEAAAVFNILLQYGNFFFTISYGLENVLSTQNNIQWMHWAYAALMILGIYTVAVSFLMISSVRLFLFDIFLRKTDLLMREKIENMMTIENIFWVLFGQFCLAVSNMTFGGSLLALQKTVGPLLFTFLGNGGIALGVNFILLKSSDLNFTQLLRFSAFGYATTATSLSVYNAYQFFKKRVTQHFSINGDPKEPLLAADKIHQAQCQC